MGSRGRGIIKEILLGSVSEEVINKSRIPVYVFKFEMKGEKGKKRCVQRHPKLFERILVGYDFSEYAEGALRYAKFVAKQTGGKIYLIHVEEPECDVQKVKDVAEEIAGEGIDAEAVVRKGNAGKQILRYAEEIDATTIFIGSKGVGAISSLLGSTSDIIVRRSKVPVFIYKGENSENKR
jgi:nucleotide-binding universal stress UspA family protein